MFHLIGETKQLAYPLGWGQGHNETSFEGHIPIRQLFQGLIWRSSQALKGTGRSEEVEISRNITFSEKILIESCGIWEDVDEIFCQNSS